MTLRHVSTSPPGTANQSTLRHAGLIHVIQDWTKTGWRPTGVAASCHRTQEQGPSVRAATGVQLHLHFLAPSFVKDQDFVWKIQTYN